MNQKKTQVFIEGGKRLRLIKTKLQKMTKPGVTPLQIDAFAEKLITDSGDYPSFKTVSGYHHTTCVNRNDEMLHGLPNDTPFVKGDVVTIDVGLVHKRYHLDTSFTFQIPPTDPKTEHFLKVGKLALKNAIAAANPKNSIYDVSLAMQQEVEKSGFSVSTQFVGHGVGLNLHEAPQIPCFANSSDKRQCIKAGQTLAIEIMYAQGDADLITDSDGWTLKTKDGSLSAMFEETVLITTRGSQVLT
jgi:methionyl aminopeptidase